MKAESKMNKDTAPSHSFAFRAHAPLGKEGRGAEGGAGGAGGEKVVGH